MTTPPTTPTATADAIRSTQRDIYSLGDYSWLARRLEPAALELVRRSRVERGDRVLDVAAGDGNVAVEAARRGARVTALDLTPAQVELGAARCAAEDLPVEWLEGDAQVLPVPDGSFDHVLSSFGAIYAPDPEAVAAELFRACAPGGRVGIVSWPADGFNERIRDVVMPYVPDDGLPLTEVAWASPEAVEALLAPHATEVTVAPYAFTLDFGSMAEFWEGISTKVPIQRLLAQMLGPEAYEAMGRDLVRLAHEFNRAIDGTVAIEMDVLIAVAVKP